MKNRNMMTALALAFGLILSAVTASALVPAGTLVTMADRTAKAIETIKIGDQVLVGDSTAAKVANVWSGREVRPILAIRLSDARILKATQNQVVATNSGICASRDLKIDDKLRTATGVASISSIYPTPFEGTLYGLDFEQRDSSDEQQLFFASGILVASTSLTSRVAAEKSAQK